MYAQAVFNSSTRAPKSYHLIGEGLHKFDSPKKSYPLAEIHFYEKRVPSATLHFPSVARLTLEQIEEIENIMRVCQNIMLHSKAGMPSLETRVIMEVIHGEHRSLAGIMPNGDIICFRYNVGDLVYQTYRIPSGMNLEEDDPILENEEGTMNALVHLIQESYAELDILIDQNYWNWGNISERFCRFDDELWDWRAAQK